MVDAKKMLEGTDVPPMSAAIDEMHRRYPDDHVLEITEWPHGIVCVLMKKNGTRFVRDGRVFPDNPS